MGRTPEELVRRLEDVLSASSIAGTSDAMETIAAIAREPIVRPEVHDLLEIAHDLCGVAAILRCVGQHPRADVLLGQAVDLLLHRAELLALVGAHSTALDPAGTSAQLYSDLWGLPWMN